MQRIPPGTNEADWRFALDLAEHVKTRTDAAAGPTDHPGALLDFGPAAVLPLSRAVPFRSRVKGLA